VSRDIDHGVPERLGFRRLDEALGLIGLKVPSFGFRRLDELDLR
jgi:hypothetical protein